MAQHSTQGEGGPSLVSDAPVETDFGIELDELEDAVASAQRRSAERRAERDGALRNARLKRAGRIAGLAVAAAAIAAAVVTIDWGGADARPGASPAPPQPLRLRH